MATAAAPDRADVLGLQGPISTLLERVNDAVRGGTPDAAPLAECLHRLLILRDDVDALTEEKAAAGRQRKTGSKGSRAVGDATPPGHAAAVSRGWEDHRTKRTEQGSVKYY